MGCQNSKVNPAITKQSIQNTSNLNEFSEQLISESQALSLKNESNIIEEKKNEDSFNSSFEDKIQNSHNDYIQNEDIFFLRKEIKKLRVYTEGNKKNKEKKIKKLNLSNLSNLDIKENDDDDEYTPRNETYRNFDSNIYSNKTNQEISSVESAKISLDEKIRESSRQKVSLDSKFQGEKIDLDSQQTKKHFHPNYQNFMIDELRNRRNMVQKHFKNNSKNKKYSYKRSSTSSYMFPMRGIPLEVFGKKKNNSKDSDIKFEKIEEDENKKNRSKLKSENAEKKYKNKHNHNFFITKKNKSSKTSLLNYSRNPKVSFGFDQILGKSFEHKKLVMEDLIERKKSGLNRFRTPPYPIDSNRKGLFPPQSEGDKKKIIPSSHSSELPSINENSSKEYEYKKVGKSEGGITPANIINKEIGSSPFSKYKKSHPLKFSQFYQPVPSRTKRASLARFQFQNEERDSIQNDNQNRSRTMILDNSSSMIFSRNNNLEVSNLGNTLLDVTVDHDGKQHLNNYKLINVIGKGTFAKVYKAKNKVNKKNYVKFI